jgi:hypothetical protein
MTSAYKWIAVVLVAGFASFFLTNVFWPQAPGGPVPGALLPWFIILSIGESLAFGLGVAFLVFGYRTVQRAGTGRVLTLLAYLSIAWYLVNWWPHDNLHRVNGQNLVGLLRIEYSFHFTMQIAGAILALFFFRILAARAGSPPASEPRWAEIEAASRTAIPELGRGTP